MLRHTCWIRRTTTSRSRSDKATEAHALGHRPGQAQAEFRRGRLARRWKTEVAQRGEIGFCGDQRRIEVSRSGDYHAVPPNEFFAFVQESPTTRILREYKNGDLRPESERNFTGVRPFCRDDETGRLAKERCLIQVAPINRFQRWIGRRRAQPSRCRTAGPLTLARPRRHERRENGRRKQRPPAERAVGNTGFAKPRTHQRECKKPAWHRPMRKAAGAPKRGDGENNNWRQAQTYKKHAALVPPVTKRMRQSRNKRREYPGR